jgi:hypothetical protein
LSSDSAQDAGQVADVVLAVLRSESPALRVQTRPWAEAFVGAKLTDPDGSTVLGETGGWVR